MHRALLLACSGPRLLPRHPLLQFSVKLIPCSSPDRVATLCADRVATCLREEEAPVLLVPAGNTPVLLLQELAARHKRAELDLAKAHWVQLDELVGVGPADPRSFHSFLRTGLSQPASLPEDRLHLLDGNAPDPEREIARHADALTKLGGGHLALLGIGANGHVAFNEPGSTRTDAARKVQLSEATLTGLRKRFEEAELPRTGITLGIAELCASAAVILLATGSNKASVIHRLITGSPHSSFPASLFMEHKAFSVVVDEQAGSLLPGESAGL